MDPNQASGLDDRPSPSAKRSDLADWRRITLDRQLPRPRFPGGVAVPSLLCAALLVVIAGLCVFYLGDSARVDTSEAVAESQRDLAASLARSVEAASDTSSYELLQAVNAYAADPRHDSQTPLDALGVDMSTSHWRWAAVLDTDRRTPLASTGEFVPAALAEFVAPEAKGVTLKPTIASDGVVELVASAPIDGGGLLVGAASLGLRPIRLDTAQRQSVLIALASGDSVHSQGVEVPASDHALAELVASAARTATEHRRTTSVFGDVGDASIVTAAPVGGIDLAVVTIVDRPDTQAGSRWRGVIPAATLVAIAVLMLLMVRFSFVRPIRRLLKNAKAVACGELGSHARLSRVTEVQRIAVAIDHLSFRAHGPGWRRPSKRARISSVAIILTAAMMIVAWAGGVMVVFGRGAEQPPAQILLDSQNQVDGLASVVEGILTTAPRELAEIAARHGYANDTTGLSHDLERLTDRDGRYRSLYLLDAHGSEVVHVGREALRGEAVTPGETGIRLDPTVDRIPLLYAYIPFDEQQTLVAEFDVRFLSSVLHRVDGTVRIVDAQMRTIASTTGFVAFSPLSPDSMRQAATESLSSHAKPLIANIGARDALVLASSFAAGSDTGAPRLAVVASRPLVDFPLPGNGVRRGAWLVSFLSICVAQLLAGWHLLVLVLPLRRVGADVTRVVNGDRTHVVSPVRHDELGAIAICVDICRQALLHGADRLAGATRLRGTAADHTAVIPRIPRERAGDAAPAPGPIRTGRPQ